MAPAAEPTGRRRRRVKSPEIGQEPPFGVTTDDHTVSFASKIMLRGKRMSLVEKLQDFAGSLACASRAPDEYDPALYVTYESNMDALREL